MKVSVVFFNLTNRIIGCVLKLFGHLFRDKTNTAFHVTICCFGLQKSLKITEAYMTSITSAWPLPLVVTPACFLSSRVTTFIVPRICLRALAVTEVHHRNKCFQFICHPQSISTHPHKRRGDFEEKFESEATSASCVVYNVPFLWSSWLAVA